MRKTNLISMSAQELLQAGKVQEAIQVLSNELRDRPGDHQRRTFLFELLCFAGDYNRAEKHLSLLSDSNADAVVVAGEAQKLKRKVRR